MGHRNRKRKEIEKIRGVTLLLILCTPSQKKNDFVKKNCNESPMQHKVKNVKVKNS